VTKKVKKVEKRDPGGGKSQPVRFLTVFGPKWSLFGPDFGKTWVANFLSGGPVFKNPRLLFL